jgi:hypothetical protein
MIEWAGPSGVNVTCAGSWEWSEHIELPEGSTGMYSQVLYLPAGRYEYKLSMDDFWFCDLKKENEEGEGGGVNVLHVMQV